MVIKLKGFEFAVVSAAFLAIASFLPSSAAHAAACCVGGGPRSFVSLQEMQNYEIGMSASFRDVYSLYDFDGSVIDAQKNQQMTLSLGGSARTWKGSEAFAIVPFIYRAETVGQTGMSDLALGDIQLGKRIQVLNNFLHTEWYPRIDVFASLKIPTAPTEPLLLGNGVWEPAVGVQFTKGYGGIILSASATYIYRVARDTEDFAGNPVRLKEGNRFDLAASGSFSWTQRLSSSIGLGAQWDGNVRIDGEVQPKSGARLLSANVGSTYFLTRYWAVSGGIEFPVPGIGKNQQAAQTFTASMTYGFY